ncbi:MAG: hypothetical protein HYX75_03860 [Acidobacteria bacterium]|nr:hypothetical protein [Acidobacteriota bacterium]
MIRMERFTEPDDLERMIADRISARAGPCPDESRLQEFAHAPSGAGGEDTTLKQHIEWCGKCRGFLREAALAARLEEEVERTPESELPVLNPSLRDRIFTSVRTAPPPKRVAAWFRGRVSVPLWTALGSVAATLLLAYPAWLGLMRTGQGSGLGAEAIRPTGQVQTLTVYGGGTRSTGDLPRLVSAKGPVVLNLPTLADLQGIQQFKAKIQDHAGNTIWEIDDLVPETGFQGFTVILPGGSLPRGRIVLSVIGYADGQERLHETFELQKE